MATSHYLEGLGVQLGRGQEPSTAEMLYAIACTLDERLGQIHNVLIRIQMTIEDLLAEVRHSRAALDPAEPEDLEPDIDDEPPPDYGPPGSGAVITEYD